VYCRRCGTEIPGDSKFCQCCGTEVIGSPRCADNPNGLGDAPQDEPKDADIPEMQPAPSPNASRPDEETIEKDKDSTEVSGVAGREALASSSGGDAESALAVGPDKVEHLIAQYGADGAAERVNEIAVAIFSAGEPLGAIPYYERALEIVPDDAIYLYNLAEALHATGDVNGAVERYRQCLTIDPDDPNAHYLYALALRDQGDLSGAIAELEKCVTLPGKAEVEGSAQDLLAELRKLEAQEQELAPRARPVAMVPSGDSQGSVQSLYGEAVITELPETTTVQQVYEMLCAQTLQEVACHLAVTTDSLRGLLPKYGIVVTRTGRTYLRRHPSTPKVRPWIRYFARYIDYFAFTFALGIVIGLTKPHWFELPSILYTAIVVINWIFFEAYLLSSWGTTPGKWLLKVRLQFIDGHQITYRDALKRSAHVLLAGMGLGIPVVSLVTHWVAYSSLKKTGTTTWDEDYGISVVHGRIGILRGSAAALFLAVCFVLMTALSNI
jgi:uncharacterized RDD family membrane protein YckC/Flp pilus assembly protein TadD